MDTVKELIEHFRKNNISTFESNKPGVIGINAKVKELVLSVKEINDKEYLHVWESFYNNKWYTFIKNTKIKEKPEFEKNQDIYQEEMIWFTDVFERDEIGDPDLLESWDDEAINRYGYSGLEQYKRHGFFWNENMNDLY